MLLLLGQSSSSAAIRPVSTTQLSGATIELHSLRVAKQLV